MCYICATERKLKQYGEKITWYDVSRGRFKLFRVPQRKFVPRAFSPTFLRLGCRRPFRQPGLAQTCGSTKNQSKCSSEHQSISYLGGFVWTVNISGWKNDPVHCKKKKSTIFPGRLSNICISENQLGLPKTVFKNLDLSLGKFPFFKRRDQFLTEHKKYTENRKIAPTIRLD